MILLRPHFRLSKIQVDLKQHLAALDEENSFYSLGDGRPGKKQSGISNKQVKFSRLSLYDGTVEFCKSIEFFSVCRTFHIRPDLLDSSSR